MTAIRAQSRPSRKSRSQDKYKILVVEDSKSAAAVLTNLIQVRWNCDIAVACTKAQAMDLIHQEDNEFILAISDLNLPDAPNGEVIDALIAEHMPVIAITGAFDKRKIDTFMNKGCIDYIIKSTFNDYEYVVELVGRLIKNSRIKVMVVDDSESFRLYTASVLRKQLLDVVEANSGEHALRILREHSEIKLVIVDYNMTGMNGIHFLTSIRQHMKKNRLCVIGMSSLQDKTLSSQFLKMGANDFIIKPFTYEELVCRVSHNLEMIESIENLRFLAEHDFLTGLFNRRAFFEYSEHIYARVVKSGGRLIAAMMDIDLFKHLNDTYGHNGGDAALLHFSNMLLEHFHSELVARVGGEEFALIIHEESGTAHRFEQFRHALENTPFYFNDYTVNMTVSIGIAGHSDLGLHESLRIADKNLYKAKLNGRNCVMSD